MKLLQAVLSSDTGLFNVIVNSIKDCALVINDSDRQSATARGESGRRNACHQAQGCLCTQPRCTARWEPGSQQPAVSGRRAECGVGSNEV